MNGVPGITHHRWYFDDANKYAKLLNAEQMGRLFFAVMRYAETLKMEDVEADIVFPYYEQCKKVDAALDRVIHGRKQGDA